MSSKKYQVLGDVSEDPLVETKQHQCCLKSWQRYLLTSAIFFLILLIVGLVITFVVLRVTEQKSNSPPSPPSLQCPATPPIQAMTCNISELTEESCTRSNCCWYGNSTCLYQLMCPFLESQRFSCLPAEDKYGNHTQEAEEVCRSRGCCWNATSIIRCSYSSDYGYTVQGGVKDTPLGVTATLHRKDMFPSMYGLDINHIKMDVTYETPYRMRVKLYDPSQSRYEVPLNMTSPIVDTSPDQKPQETLYSFSVINNNNEKEGVISDSFAFQIKRASTQQTLFKVASGLVFSEQFLQLSAHLPSQFIYGLGEHATPWKLSTNYSKLTLFARDVPPDPVYDTTRNLYGVHPMYLCMEDNDIGTAHGVFFLNSNAMEIELLPYPAITYRTIGGVLDFYFFLGPTPDDVISQYTELIGRPFLPPYWSLGFHLCRWGYYSSNRTLEVVERMREHGIPQDTQWNDIDYMSQHLDFTYNHTTYNTLPQLVQNLHQHGQHYVVITDPGISATLPPGDYPPFDDGVADDIFILNSTGGPLLGQVWPGVTAYPDFTNPATQSYWLNQMEAFHDNVSFDGLWIDMNEPSNFIPGSIYDCPNSTLNDPPYLPISIRQQGSIVDKTVCMTGQQYISSHYNVHSLYGHTEAIETMNSLQLMLKKRSLVISRSTYPGSGTHCGHWLGDNASQWPHLRQSIPGILNFALFGIPLVGADICGFFDNTTAQLCTRWQQLGAFYPFSRNHNTYNTIPQDPTEFDEDSIAAIRSALLTRYKLLPFLYTLFYYAHTNGSMVATPLLSVFPSDKETWSNGHQFMWGKGLLISPVLEENATSVMAYFPKGRWFDYYNGSELTSTGYITLDAPLSFIPLHVLGGNILPQQAPNTTTTLSRKNPFSLLVALNENGNSFGSLFLDDGEELGSVENKHYSLLSFEVKSGQLKSIVHESGFTAATNSSIDSITIYGLSQSPSSVTVNSVPNNNWKWSSDVHVLHVNVNIVNLNEPFTMEWST